MENLGTSLKSRTRTEELLSRDLGQWFSLSMNLEGKEGQQRPPLLSRRRGSYRCKGHGPNAGQKTWRFSMNRGPKQTPHPESLSPSEGEREKNSLLAYG